VDLLGMELACLACRHQLDGILEGCRLVKSVLKGFIDQRAGRCMVSALASMVFCEQIAALLLGNTLHYDTIRTMPVEIPFYQCVSLSQTGNPISENHVIGKDVVFHVGSDLHNLCIRTSLSF
jgi:hypothetical protein